MANSKEGGNIVTSEVRLSFVNAFKPQKQENGDEKYSVVLLFPDPKTLTGQAKTDYDTTINKLKMAATAAAKEKWGDKIPANLRSPFRNQGEKEYEGYVDGALFISATSKQKPGVVDASVQPIIDSAQLYSGCYARVSVRAFAYEKQGNRGVAFGLQNIQKTRDGDPLSGRSKPEDDFSPVEDAAVATGEAGATALFG